jgi:hypothetical protein
LLSSDEIGVSNLIGRLDAKKITVFLHTPVPDKAARRHAEWWQPERYGQCEAFKVSTENQKKLTVLMGYVVRTTTNRLVFLNLIINQR